MALFGRKSAADRQAEGMRMANNIAQGKGFTGKLAQAFIGAEGTQALQDSMASVNAGQQVQALLAAGVPTQEATVVSLQDTGQTVNDNPHVVLIIDLEGQQIGVAALLSRLEIPRVGEKVLVLRDPQSGQLLYAGLAPRV